jgi:hypothetical protein
MSAEPVTTVPPAVATPTVAESPGVASEFQLGTGLFWVVVVAVVVYVLWRVR